MLWYADIHSIWTFPSPGGGVAGRRRLGALSRGVGGPITRPPRPPPRSRFLSSQGGAAERHHRHEKGKPVARRGRKATGPTKSAGLPKGDSTRMLSTAFGTLAAKVAAAGVAGVATIGSLG